MTGKNKNILLAFLLLLSLFISYRLAFSKTVNLRNEYEKTKDKTFGKSDLNQTLFRLKQQKIYNDSILNKHRYLTNSSFQNNLLQSITKKSNEYSLEVLKFGEPLYFEKNNTSYTNYQISLKGAYENILKLLYTIEEEYKYGKLLTVNFEKKKNYKTGRQFLVVDFVLQRIE